MDYVKQFNTEVVKFAHLMFRLSEKVKTLMGSDNIKSLKENRLDWTKSQKQGLQDFVASQSDDVEEAMSFARTYREYFVDYFHSHPHALQDLRWVVYGLLEADFFNQCNLRRLMDLVVNNVPDAERASVIHFYNACVIRSLVPSQSDIFPHSYWLLGHYDALLPHQLFSILWRLHRHQSKVIIAECLYNQIYKPCRDMLCFVSGAGLVGAILFLTNGGADYWLAVALHIVAFIAPLIVLYIFRPRS